MRKGERVSATNQYYDYQDKFKERKGHIFFKVFSNFRNISWSQLPLDKTKQTDTHI